MVLGLVFLVIERVWQALSYSKSWRIPNYQISKSYKNLSFFIAWFSKNSRKRVSKSGVLRSIAWASVIKRFIWFFKNCAPRGNKVSYSNGFKMKGSVYRDGFITNSNHQFFQDPKSNIWITFSFSFFCSDFMIMKFIPF